MHSLGRVGAAWLLHRKIESGWPEIGIPTNGWCQFFIDIVWPPNFATFWTHLDCKPMKCKEGISPGYPLLSFPARRWFCARNGARGALPLQMPIFTRRKLGGWGRGVTCAMVMEIAPVKPCQPAVPSTTSMWRECEAQGLLVQWANVTFPAEHGMILQGFPSPALKVVARKCAAFVPPIYQAPYQPINLPTHLPVYLSTHQPTYLSTYQHNYQPTYLSTYQPTNLPTHLPINLPTHQPTYLSTSQPTYLSTYQPTNLHTYLPINLPTHQPTYLSTYLPINLRIPTHQPLNLSTYQPTNPPTYLPIYLSTFQPTNLPTYQPINLPTHQPTYPQPFQEASQRSPRNRFRKGVLGLQANQMVDTTIWAPWFRESRKVIWLWLSKPMGSHFGWFRTYFSGDWDVHWRYGLLTHGHILTSRIPGLLNYFMGRSI